MDAVIFAGECEFDRCPLSLSRPKALWPFGGGTVIDFQLRRLAAQGFRRAVICANRGADELRRHLSERTFEGLSPIIAEDPLPRGPAGCLHDAAIHLGAGPAAALDVGSLTAVDWPAAFARHADSGAPLSVGMTADRLGRPQAAGLYVWDASLLRHIPARGFQDIKERLLPALAAIGRAAVPMNLAAPRQCLDSPADYLAALALRPDEPKAAPAAPGVHPSVRNSGDVRIEPGACVAENAVLIGPTLIAAGAVVGVGALIRNSAVWPEARVGAGAHLDRCVLTTGAAVAPLSRHRQTVVLADDPGAGGRHALRFRGYRTAGSERLG